MQKIYSIPLDRTGTHETFVIVVDGIPQSVETWNFTETANGDRTFYINGVTTWQLYFRADTIVQVIR